MGLSAPRKRAKLSHDPNNTEWSRSTTKYGQKILESQGWRSGDFLGAKDAKHAECHTLANSSQIKIALKDDTLGLGARPGATTEGRATGLDTFQDILGRLNGKSTIELDAMKKSRSDAKRSAFVDQKWGSFRFVSGGLLVGDEIRKLSMKKDHVEKVQESCPDTPLSGVSKRKEHKKSKASRELQANGTASTGNALYEALPQDALAGQNACPQDSGTDIDTDPQKLEEARNKADKIERKMKRKLKRDAKQAMKHLKSKNRATIRTPNTTEVQQQSDEHVVSLEAVSNIQAPKKYSQAHGGGRNAVRSRYIQQKKMAFMDSKALNEILMIKT